MSQNNAELTRVTSFDVARRAGVSQSTVSRALRGESSIGPSTVRRVLQAAEALQYVPSARARDLATGSTRRIAMVVDLDNPLWSLLVSRLHDQLADRGYQLTLVAAHGELVDADQLLGGSIDGVLLSSSRRDSPLPAALRHRAIPAVLLHRYVQGSDLDASVADNDAGGAAAARMLLEAGHRRIGALFGPADTSTGRDRESGFRRALAAAGRSLPAHRVRHGDFTLAYGEAAFAAIVGGARGATAVFCSNDTIAVGAMNAAHATGIRVPHDVALVGFDDLDTSAWPLISLSTIRVPFDDMLRTAVNLLFERIAGHQGGGRKVVHPVEPVARATHLAHQTSRTGAQAASVQPLSQ